MVGAYRYAVMIGVYNELVHWGWVGSKWRPGRGQAEGVNG
jgi:hypothetical protein